MNGEFEPSRGEPATNPLGAKLAEGAKVLQQINSTAHAGGKDQIWYKEENGPKNYDYQPIDAIRLTSHRLLFKINASRGCLWNADPKIINSLVDRGKLDVVNGRPVRRPGLDEWFGLRLDCVSNISLKGTGLFRAKKLIINFNCFDFEKNKVSCPVELSIRLENTGLVEKLESVISLVCRNRAWMTHANLVSQKTGKAFVPFNPSPRGNTATRSNQLSAKNNSNNSQQRSPNSSRSPRQLSASTNSASSSARPDAIVQGGVAAALARHEDKMRANANISDQGLQDIETLKQDAQALVTLAKRMSAKAEVESEVKDLLKEYGLFEEQKTAISEKAAEKDLAHLACSPNDVAKVCERALKSTGGSAGSVGMMLVHDLYCLFNRLRGTDIVAPGDLMETLAVCGKNNQKYPIFVHKLQNGSKVVMLREMWGGSVEDETGEEKDGKDNLSKPKSPQKSLGERLGERIVSMIDEHGPLSAQKLAELWNISVALAALQLKEAELTKSPKVCRDDSIEGLFFYRNFFI